MAYEEQLASRIRQSLTRRSVIEERAMFGGLCFMVRGRMCCGVVKDQLMVRVDPASYDQLLGEPGAQPMDFTGKPMRGFLYVTGVGLSTVSALDTWVGRALDFAESQPAKVRSRSRLKSKGRPNRHRASPRQADRSLPSGRRPKPSTRASKRGR
jgi:TfoX/Sxy family transcriptional regulator of competence genes